MYCLIGEGGGGGGGGGIIIPIGVAPNMAMFCALLGDNAYIG